MGHVDLNYFFKPGVDWAVEYMNMCEYETGVYGSVWQYLEIEPVVRRNGMFHIINSLLSIVSVSPSWAYFVSFPLLIAMTKLTDESLTSLNAIYIRFKLRCCTISRLD